MTCIHVGIAHRDLKPENILCENEDEVSTSMADSVAVEMLIPVHTLGCTNQNMWLWSK